MAGNTIRMNNHIRSAGNTIGMGNHIWATGKLEMTSDMQIITPHWYFIDVNIQSVSYMQTLIFSICPIFSF